MTPPKAKRKPPAGSRQPAPSTERRAAPRRPARPPEIEPQPPMEQALRASEVEWRHIVEIANEGIWITDAAQKTIFVNQRLADLLGYAREEMLGRASKDFLAEGAEQPERKTRPKLNRQAETQKTLKLLRPAEDGVNIMRQIREN